MKSNPLTKTVRRIGLAASVASVALLTLTSPGALAAAPDAQKQNWQQPPAPQQQHPQQQLQLQPRQQNNRVNQMQPQPNLKVQPKQQQFQKQQQQKQIQQNIQPTPAQQPKLQTQQPLAPQQQKQAQQFPRFDWNTYHPGQRPPQWEQYRANFNPAPYQWNRPAVRVYYVPVYQPPPGWYYRRWAYGQIYPQAYWAQPYWISNYYDYGLPPLPYGFVWVRNGPDAMSVDIVTGLILNVVYGLFGSGGGLL